MLNKISFEIAEIDGAGLSLTPCVDDTPLSALISEFETANDYIDPAGGYGGIVPSDFDYGPLLQYFCGQARNPGVSDNDGEIFVLGCECGEVGCWPLMASVTRVRDGYRWSGFIQPHRPERNYDGFGPFVFEKDQYEAAVRDAVLRLKRAR